jgi:hypothetical protein
MAEMVRRIKFIVFLPEPFPSHCKKIRGFAGYSQVIVLLMYGNQTNRPAAPTWNEPSRGNPGMILERFLRPRFFFTTVNPMDETRKKNGPSSPRRAARFCGSAVAKRNGSRRLSAKFARKLPGRSRIGPEPQNLAALQEEENLVR